MPRTAHDAARLLPEELRQKLAQAPVRVGDAEIRLSVSAGPASCRQRGNTMEQLVQSADRALYDAREAGRNRIMGYLVRMTDAFASAG